jgi:transposase-like protein
MHSTKMSLYKWLMVIYYIVTSSKGIASVILARWIGVSQKTSWKMGHAIRAMMANNDMIEHMLTGIVEVDETYIGGKPQPDKDHPHKRGKGTDKQLVFVATERHGKVYSSLIDSDKKSELKPLCNTLISKDAHLMTDGNRAYPSIAKDYSDHSAVIHSSKEFSRGDIHINTAESFNSLFERARTGVFYYISTQHLKFYLSEAGFRWNHRRPEEKQKKNGERETLMIPIPVMDMIKSLLKNAVGIQVRRTLIGGIEQPV